MAVNSGESNETMASQNCKSGGSAAGVRLIMLYPLDIRCWTSIKLLYLI